MATLVLDDEQKMLREAAMRFMAEKAPVAQLRALRDGEGGAFDAATWSAMAEMGFPGALIPEQHGGAGFGHVAMGQIMEAGGRTLAASPLFATGVAGACAIGLGGSEAQKAELLPKIASGELLCALAVDEGPRHTGKAPATQARPEGQGWAITGAKVNVADGGVAGLVIVSAVTPEGAAGLFLVEAGARGLEVERVEMADSRDTAILRFEATPAAALGEVSAGGTTLSQVVDICNAHLAAELVGIAGKAFEDTLAYVQERKQFGVTIASFQAIQHRAAHLFGEIEQARSLVLAALSGLDEGAENLPRLISAAKAKAASVADLATNEGVQLHGGVGMTDAYDIGLFMKRARPAAQLFGDGRFHADRFAALSGY
ncbi:acyl-CoA dehydrogenase [uncultured Albimonas sp.]|uniref:acyl-CoA dehydrogenase family protein n=1 Tax=uncultured Albimonas sp. TaxID=1331701 RepID=UPI0030EDDBBC